jgi:alkylation response protein AidB-like acyl-CoA dehydrogenase
MSLVKVTFANSILTLVTAVSPGAQALPGPGLVTAQECVQLHGGTGLTWEHPADLYRKRG